MKRRLWIVSELYAPDAQATSRILTTLAEGLASEYDVNVLCAFPTMQFDPSERARSAEVRNGVKIRRFVSTRLDKAVLLFRFLNLFTISVPVLLYLLFHAKRSDTILVVTNPPVMPFIAAVAASFRGASVVVLTHDVYPDALIATGILKESDVTYRALQRMARWLHDRVDAVIVLGRDMERLVRSYVRKESLPIRIIPNWSEPDRITVLPRSENSLLKKHGLIDAFVILHAGTMGRTHGIEDLIACSRALASDPDIHFLFAGVGVKGILVEREAADPRSSNVTILPFVDAKYQNDLLNACDVAVIAMIPGMAGISVPSRMYNTMASGKPIVAVTDDNSELAEVVREKHIGWVVAPGDVAGLRDALLEAKTDPGRRLEMGIRARKVAEGTYTAGRSIEGFRQVLKELED